MADTFDKKFVLNADDFGMSNAYNTAILEGTKKGILKSASLVANGEAFDEAIEKVIPACPELGVGVHLNIIEGKAMIKDQPLLTDVNGNFNNSYGSLIMKAYSRNNKEFIEQLDKEFSAQIDKIKDAGVKITHIDSHVHTHAIPPIFELVCKIAKDYEIPQIRTQHEHIYSVPDVLIYLNKTYPLNLIKIALLNFFTAKNRKIVRKYGLNTNDFLIGVGYTSMMNSMTVAYGLSAVQHKKNIVAEALIHPCRYEDGTIDNHFTEYRITQSERLRDRIAEMGYEIGNYKQEDQA